jgi:hypothetical protein
MMPCRLNSEPGNAKETGGTGGSPIDPLNFLRGLDQGGFED